MRPISAAVLGLAMLVPVPANALFWGERPQAPWCAVYSIGLGETRWDCFYPTLESCVPNILAGTRGFCNPNPRYPGPPPKPRRHRGTH